MVLQKAINNLKGRPRHERKVVAGAIAIATIAVLFLGWAILFFHEIQGNDAQIAQPVNTPRAAGQ